MNGLKSASVWIAIFLVFVVMYVSYSHKPAVEPLSIVRFSELASTGRIVGKVVDRGTELEGTYRDDNGKEKKFTTKYIAGQESEILKVATANKLEYVANQSSALFSQLLVSLILPILIFVGLWFLVMRQLQGGNNKAMSFGKSRARVAQQGATKVTFEDVAGCDEAKEELKEIVEFLKDPQKFGRLGGHIPKGVLLVGPPGTGKTLLARAIAGEANVPFLSISGSDFVEMFVGVGASRVRDLFEQAKKQKPCLIFMDEIDAVGRHRGMGMGGGHDEREQTLNQLLVEMDGFAANEGVILIAATNRPDVLDPALLRPGRFDRQITVDYPDVRGREQILAVHAKNVKLSKAVDLKTLAKSTSGFSGADLANVINEAALLAARYNQEEITMRNLQEATDRVIMGPERRSLVLTDLEKKLTAYHEAGHAITAKMVDSGEQVHKVTIIPRGRALGVTSYLPSEERFSYFKNKLKDKLVYMLGGRAAEQITFGDFTTGAGNDLMRATGMARRMVCEFGMSEALGARTYGDTSSQGMFLGRDFGNNDRDFSEKTAAVIDEEIRALVDTASKRATDILTEHKDKLVAIAEALIERETLDGEEFEALMRGETLPERPADPEPPAEPPAAEAEEKKERPKIFGQSILDRPQEQPS